MITIIEIKSLCNTPYEAEQKLLEHGAFLYGIDKQTDTYLEVPNGRLKIREGTVENNIIYYKRTEKKDSFKESHVDLIAINESNYNFIHLLKDILSTKVVVKKTRKIFFIEHIKFHIDEVEDLGNFIEIEAIDNNGLISKDQLTLDCEYYMQLLSITQQDIISGSYSDMLLQKNKV